MPLGTFLSKIFGGGASGLIDSVTGAIDKLTLSKEEKEAFKIETVNAMNAHIEKMQELAQAETDSIIKDMADARDREITIATSEKAHWITKNTTSILALGFVGTTLLLYTLSILKAIDIQKDILRDLRDLVMLIMAYYFGSSLGSKMKSEQLASK